MFAPRPVKPFFCHPERDDDVDLGPIRFVVPLAIGALRLCLQRGLDAVAPVAVIHEVSYLQNLAVRGAFHQIEPGVRIAVDVFTDGAHDQPDLIVLFAERLS